MIISCDKPSGPGELLLTLLEQARSSSAIDSAGHYHSFSWWLLKLGGAVLGGGGNSAFRKALHFPLKEVSSVSPWIGGILSTLFSLV